jgi:hypothetical protein
MFRYWLTIVVNIKTCMDAKVLVTSPDAVNKNISVKTLKLTPLRHNGLTCPLEI